MQIILAISFIAILVVLLKNSRLTLNSIQSASLVMKIGIFTLVAGWVISLSGNLIGFGDFLALQQAVSILYLITFVCVIIGIVSFLMSTQFSINRKIGFFSLVVGFLSTLFVSYIPVITTIIPSEFDPRIVGLAFYVVFVMTLLIELYQFIFKTSTNQVDVD